MKERLEEIGDSIMGWLELLFPFVVVSALGLLVGMLFAVLVVLGRFLWMLP